MVGRTLRIESQVPKESAIVIGTTDELERMAPQFSVRRQLEPDSFSLRRVNGQRKVFGRDGRQ